MRPVGNLLFRSKNGYQNPTNLQDPESFSYEFIFIDIIHYIHPTSHHPKI